MPNRNLETDIALALAAIGCLVATQPARKRLQWMRRMRRMIGDPAVIRMFSAKADAALSARYERLLPILLDHDD